MNAVRLSFQALRALRGQMGEAGKSVSRIDSKSLLFGNKKITITDLLHMIVANPGAAQKSLEDWAITLAWVLQGAGGEVPKFTRIVPFVWPLLANLAEESKKAGDVYQAILQNLDAVAVVRVSGQLITLQHAHLLHWNLTANTVSNFAAANVAITGCTFKVVSSGISQEDRVIRVQSEDGFNSSRIVSRPVLQGIAHHLTFPFLVWIPTWYSLLACRDGEARLRQTCQAIANTEFRQVTHSQLTTSPLRVSEDTLSWAQ